MARVTMLAGLPIEQHSSPNVGGAMSAHRGSVLHIAEGTYRGTISWQMNPDQRYASGGKTTTSSTWVVGKAWGEWAQMADTDIVAWCQRSGSRTRNSIELAGHSGDKPTAWQIEACAQIFAWEHQHYGVPLQVADTDAELGLCHHSADREWAGVEWGHDDCPGAGVIAAKPQIVARAKQILAPTPPPPPAPPTYRHPIATLALEGDTAVPKYLIKHADHPEVFGVWPSGLVRHIGSAEYKMCTTAQPPVPLEVSKDAEEYQRLLMYTTALQGPLPK